MDHGVSLTPYYYNTKPPLDKNLLVCKSAISECTDSEWCSADEDDSDSH